MKRSGKLLLLLGLLVLVLGAYFIVPILVTDEDEDTSADTEIIQVFSTPRESILEIQWTYLGETNTIARDTSGGLWYCPDDLMLEVDQSIGDAMLAGIYSITATSSLEPTGALSEYTLDPPLVYVKITLDSGEEYTFGTGKYNSFAEAYYLMYNDYVDVVYMCENPPMDEFAYLREDLDGVDEEAETSDSAEDTSHEGHDHE